jgi:hypothetical protein
VVTESRPGQAMTVPDNAPASQGRDRQDACWREAARLRSQFRGWIVVWLAPENCYRAYRRLPGAHRDTAISAATPGEIAALIGQAEQAAAARWARSEADRP